jgi:two-component system response regulator YcbB
MLSIYIVDDDPSIVTILEDIVNKYFPGALLGTASNGIDAIKEIKLLKPEIILLDFLLPDKDGLAIIRAIREEYHQGVIMISEVSDKQMIAKAYKENIEFFISKPINVIEVVSIIKKVSEHQQIKNTLNKFENVLSSLKVDLGQNDSNQISAEQKLKKLYSKLGLVGAIGCDDLIEAVLWAKNQSNDYTLADMYNSIGNGQAETIKKRISRVIAKAFRSLASLGVEDFMNPLFEEYGSTLFDFTEMRKEMSLLDGKSDKSGKINVKQFIENSIMMIEEK